jgi:hypothetical protein
MTNDLHIPDKHSNAEPSLQQARVSHNERRFQQLNNLLIGHAEGALQYLLTVNGGGCVAMLGLVGAVEKWRVQDWPYWVLATYTLGLLLAGVGRTVMLIHTQYLLKGWIKDTGAYFDNTLEWGELTIADKARVGTYRPLPWVIGTLSLACFIGGTFAAGYLFARLR